MDGKSGVEAPLRIQKDCQEQSSDGRRTKVFADHWDTNAHAARDNPLSCTRIVPDKSEARAWIIM
jgi:hypothetical protein